MSRAQAGRSDDPAVAAALAFALKVVEDRGQVGDADVQRLRDAGYGDEQVMEILAHGPLNIITNYTNVAFGEPVAFPEAGILPQVMTVAAGASPERGRGPGRMAAGRVGCKKPTDHM